MHNEIGSEIKTGEIKVWDLLVRVFHWSLVLAFVVAYLSGEEESDVHIYAGYIIFGLIVFRLIWGFIGSQHARFRDFVCSPQTIISHLKMMLSGKSRRYLGHNPAGGAMVLALLLGLAVTTYSGLEVYAIEEGAGPLAYQGKEISLIPSAYADDDEEYGEHVGYDEEDEDEEDFWEEVHEASANFVLFLVFLHIAGVIVSGRLNNENLVKAMLTGKKKP